MNTENLIAKAGLFFVLAMLFGMCISWKYCGCELMFVACFYMVRALCNEIRIMLNDLKNMRWIIRLSAAELLTELLTQNLQLWKEIITTAKWLRLTKMNLTKSCQIVWLCCQALRNGLLKISGCLFSDLLVSIILVFVMAAYTLTSTSLATMIASS